MTEMARALSEEMEKNEQLEKQLTEAKEIMSSMLNAMKRLNVYKTQGGIMDKAEAFLKE